MQKYKCIKEFYLPKYDENECPTDEYATIHEGSVYEYTDGYVGESDIRLYWKTVMMTSVILILPIKHWKSILRELIKLNIEIFAG